MERGKVQISAYDLSRISYFLNSPIEFFFGDEFSEQDIQDMIVLVRNQPPEVRTKSIEMLKIIMQMQTFGNSIRENPEKEISPEEIGNFYANLITLSKQVKDMSNQLENMKDMFFQALKDQGIPIPG
jgi:hypothetical protein